MVNSCSLYYSCNFSVGLKYLKNLGEVLHEICNNPTLVETWQIVLIVFKFNLNGCIYCLNITKSQHCRPRPSLEGARKHALWRVVQVIGNG